MKELFEIKGLPVEYVINKQGQIFSYFSQRFLTEFTNSKGYKYYTLSINGKNKNYLTSRLLAFVFLDLPSLDSALEVDHIDSNLENNKLDNLQVLTAVDHNKKTCKDLNYKVHDKKYCKTCNKLLDSKNISGFCLQHYKPETKIIIKAEDIEYWVRSYSWVRAAKELGLSDNGLRKRYKKLTGKDPKSIKDQKLAQLVER